MNLTEPQAVRPPRVDGHQPRTVTPLRSMVSLSHADGASFHALFCVTTKKLKWGKSPRGHNNFYARLGVTPEKLTHIKSTRRQSRLGAAFKSLWMQFACHII